MKDWDYDKYCSDFKALVARLGYLDPGMTNLVKRHFLEYLPKAAVESVMCQSTYPKLTLAELESETRRQLAITNHFRQKDWSAKRRDDDKKDDASEKKKVAWKKPHANVVNVPIEEASDSDSDEEYDDKDVPVIVGACDVDGDLWQRSLGGSSTFVPVVNRNWVGD